MTGNTIRFQTAPAPSGAAWPRPSRAGRARLRLLGGFGLWLDEEPTMLPSGLQRLVALLALRGASGRSRLAGSLWPDVTEPRAMSSLRTAIWRVNQLAPGLVMTSHGTVGLEHGTEVDVHHLVESSRALLSSPQGGAALDHPAPEGELLPDWEDEWLGPERERLRQLRLHVLEAHAERLLGAGAFGLALDRALAALRADPLRESAHRAVIRIHLAEGNVAAARDAYAECIYVLARELDVAPSRQTLALLPSIRGDRAVAELPDQGRGGGEGPVRSVS